MAETPKSWWRGCVIYEIYPRSFRDSNGDGIGDLAGVTERLGHVADLGVDAIWLTPFFVSPMRDFGYDVADYCAVDGIFGTIADFERLVEEAHRLGLKVLIDQVISHTSDAHPWFRESRASRTGKKADWYVWADMKPDGSAPNNWLSVFGGPSWQWDSRRRQYYLHNFLVEQPDLNLHNPEVQDAVLDAMRFWLERGVDGFRLDALNFGMHDRRLRDNPPAEDLGESEQTDANPYAFQTHLYDKSQPEMLGMLERIRALLDEYGETTSLAEIGEGGHRALQLMSEYAGSGKRLHMCYSFVFLGPRFSPAFVRETIEGYEAAAGGAWPCWSFSNHDVIRHATRWAERPGDRPAVVRMALGLLLALRGSVCLYQGEELGLTEAEIAFENLQDPAGRAFWPEYKGRDGCRTPMPWDGETADAGFGSTAPWLPIPDEHRPLSVETQTDDPHSVLAFYKHALAVRKAAPALRFGAIEFVSSDENTLVFRRTEGGESVLCQFNFGAKPVRLAMPRGEVLLASDGAEEGTLPAHGFRWIAER